MNNFERLFNQLRLVVASLLISNVLIVIGVWVVGRYILELSPTLVIGSIVGLELVLAVVFSQYITGRALEPLRFLWQAIVHVSPDHPAGDAPNLDKIHTGRELVTSLAMQIYQLASNSAVPAVAEHSSGQAEMVINNLPIPVLVLDKTQTIIFANSSAGSYIGISAPELTGKSMYSVLDLAFRNDQTFDSWLAACRQDKVTATNTWERVRWNNAGQSTKKQFDMVAYYNKNNPDNVETIVALFDQTNRYSQDDDSLGFVALAVHELRTPLTIMRGYIEVLQEELAGKLDPETTSFIQRLEASSQQLAAFVTNILNVARVEENQLFLELKEESWQPILEAAVADLRLRAEVRGKTIELSIEPDLPSVGVDRTSIYEVINNLVDNALKYSDKSNRIVIKSYKSNDGQVETTVQDFGIGVPANIIGNLFDKFYRNHRSRAQVGGTGLGLYLSKAIISAHGGQIWVQSKENEGSTFGFSLIPYTELAEELKNNDNKDITRTAHGWIKNHSFYRR